MVTEYKTDANNYSITLPGAGFALPTGDAVDTQTLDVWNRATSNLTNPINKDTAAADQPASQTMGAMTWTGVFNTGIDPFKATTVWSLKQEEAKRNKNDEPEVKPGDIA